MRNTRTASRLLALALTVLMLASCFVALPAMAEETAPTPTVLWSYDFDSVGNIPNADIKSNSTNYAGGYLVNKNAFYCVSGTNYAATSTSSATAITTGAGSSVFKGLLSVGGGVMLTDQTTANGKRDFFDLMYGIYGKQVDGETRPTQTTPVYAKGSTYFWEFDFAQNSSTIQRDTSGTYTLNGETVTLSADHAIYCDSSVSKESGGGSFFTMQCGGGNQYALFRITNDGYMFAKDNEASYSGNTVPADNAYYVLDANGDRTYLPKGTALTSVTGFWYRQDATKGYKIELDTQYRIGVEFTVKNIQSDGQINMLATVYIKPEGQENWDACVGTTDYYYRDTDYTGTYTVNAQQRAIKIADNSYYLYFGGDTSIYTYECDGTNHLNLLETPSESDASVLTLSCIDCGKSWQERLIDGVYYTGVATAATCDKGSYMIWVPKNGVGTAFADSAYTVPATGHTYNSSGVCTACRKPEVEGYMSKGFYASGSAGSKTAPTTYTTNDGGHIYKENNGTTFIFGDVANGAYKIGDRTKPFTIGFDLKLDEVKWRSGKDLGNFVELVSLVNSSNGDTTQLLAVGKAPDGTPFLSFPYDFDGGVKTKETVAINLTEDGKLDTTDADYEKFQKYFAACAAPGQDPNTAVGGPITDTSDNIVQYNYFTTSEADDVKSYTFWYPQVSQYNVPVGEWFHVAVTVIPDSANNAQILLYVNGELMAQRPAAIAWKTSWQSVRFGQGADRFTEITTTRYDNFSFRVHESLSDAYTAETNEMVSLTFDKYSLRPFDPNFDASQFGNAISAQLTRVGTFSNTVDTNAVVYKNATHGSYAHFNKASVASSDSLQFALSTQLGGDSTSTLTGTVYNVVSDAGKYEINLRIAVDENSPIYGENADGSTYSKDMIRLSKYRDNFIKVVLMGLGESGYSAGSYPLYDVNGNRVSPYTTVTGNVPEKFSDVRVVVDETKNTYSIYVDDQMTYYRDGNSLRPYCDMTIPIDTASSNGYKVADNDSYKSLNIDKTQYSAYTQEYFEAMVANRAFGPGDTTKAPYSYNYTSEIVRFFQSWSNFYVQDISVSVIPDSKVEMIGVQEQVGDNSFDLRFVAGIDDIYVQNIDFEVKAYYNDSYEGVQNVSVTEVFSSVKETSGSMYAYECTEGEYLAAFKVVGMERTGASNRYKFVVTPTTTLADGTTVEGDSFTVVYDGEGRYLGNDKPFDVDLSQYEDLGTKPVMLELHAKSGEGDYEDFYIYTRCSDASGRYYVRYRMTYYYDTRTTNETNSATNLDSFRITGAELIKVNGVSDTAVSYTKFNDLLSAGEISLAIKEYVYGITGYEVEKDESGNTVYETEIDENGNPVLDENGDPVYVLDSNNKKIPVYATDENGEKIPTYGNTIPDFCGGFHGDEKMVVTDGTKQFALKADDVSYTPGTENKLVQCSEVTFDMTTQIDRWAAEAGSAGQIVTHEQNFSFTDDGMAIDRKITWLVDDFVIDSAYPMMFTLLRLDGEDAICEIVQTFDANGNSLGKETLPLHNTERQRSVLQNADLRKVEFSSATSGISAVASFTLGENNDGVLSSPYIAYRMDGGGADNKLYIPMKGGTNVTVDANTSSGTTTKTQPALGDVWEISTFYNIDYIRPAN